MDPIPWNCNCSTTVGKDTTLGMAHKHIVNNHNMLLYLCYYSVSTPRQQLGNYEIVSILVKPHAHTHKEIIF